MTFIGISEILILHHSENMAKLMTILNSIEKAENQYDIYCFNKRRQIKAYSSCSYLFQVKVGFQMYNKLNVAKDNVILIGTSYERANMFGTIFHFKLLKCSFCPWDLPKTAILGTKM